MTRYVIYECHRSRPKLHGKFGSRKRRYKFDGECDGRAVSPRRLLLKSGSIDFVSRLRSGSMKMEGMKSSKNFLVCLRSS